MKVRNTFIIFIVSGFWHGANWTFIAWGTLNALYFLPLLLTNNNRNHIEVVAQNKLLPNIKELYLIFSTFCLTVFAWIFFRAENITHAFQYIKDMFLGLITKSGYVQTFNLIYSKIDYVIFILLFLFIIIEWLGRNGEHALSNLGLKWKRPLRYILYYIITFIIFWFSGKEQQFIYFKF